MNGNETKQIKSTKPTRQIQTVHLTSRRTTTTSPIECPLNKQTNQEFKNETSASCFRNADGNQPLPGLIQFNLSSPFGVVS